MANQDANTERSKDRDSRPPHPPSGEMDDSSWQAEDDSAQLLEPSGVSKDVASIAINGSVLPGQRQQSGRFAVSEEVRRQRLEDPNDDAAIMMRVSAGDNAAFDFLVEKYRRAMMSFMYRMVHNQAVAEELAQEVFLRVYRSRESYRADAKFTTWLYRIATNLAVNHARDTKNERSASTVELDKPDPESGSMPDVADSRSTVEQDILRRERLAAIRRHVMMLPERQRMAVLMHKYQGLDYKQIGEVLKLSESATKSLLFRAYETLRERLQQFI